MISKTFSIFWCLLIVQCGLVFSVDKQRPEDSKQSPEIPSISLSELLATYRSYHHDFVDGQLTFMMFAASYGDRLYNLPVNVSATCSRIARANSLMLGKLATCEEVVDVIFEAVDEVTRDLKKRTELKEHPLELVCTKLERRYAEETNLRGLFEKAKVKAADFNFTSHRQPYFGEILKGKELLLKMIEKSDIVDLAQLVAFFSVRSVLRGSSRGNFIKSCRDVAKQEKFDDSMQKVYESAVIDVLPEIMATDRVEKFKLSSKSKGNLAGMWWISSLEKSLQGYVAKVPILKKEVDNMAAITGEDTSQYD